MGGINLNESGLDFVRQVFVTFGGNTTVLTLFLLSVLYLALKGKKEERYVFVTTAVFLAFTVYNPFAVKYILGKLGMVNVYYRGHSIGKILADDLGIKYYDKELLERAAKDSGLCQELFENHDEKPTNSFLYSLVMDSYSFGYGSTMMDMPLNQKVFLAQFDAIKKISQDGPCVIVGRCADYALEENPNVLSIFIKADMQDRIRRIAKLYDLSDAKAKDKITKIDKQRASYYNYYTSKRWGEVDSYDLCLNSSVFGIDGTVDMIKQAIEVKEAGIRKIFST